MIVIIAVFLSVITVVGNIMVMISFKIDKQLQTTSNYFLFSLAVADFAIGLISMPLFTVYTVLGYWPLGPHVCDTWLALDYLASNASVLNLLIISFDRYFSIKWPLSYRVKRTTSKAAIMIASAWGISLLLWPPWIYAWPYIEGQRTVPGNACYIQFIETNHYITFGTAIAAFYVPVTVMITLYWRIWKETTNRQKTLPYLQAGKEDASKRSTSSYCICFFFDISGRLDTDDSRRPRSESSTGVSDMNSTHIAVSYLDRHYSQYETVSIQNDSHNNIPFSWMWLKMWCIAWWLSGRDDDDDDDDEDEVDGAESSRTGPGYDEVITPLSAETPLTGTVSRSPSISGIHSTTLTTDKSISFADNHEYGKPGKVSELSTKRKYTDGPSIKMYHNESPASIIRRPSQMPDIRMPLNTKNIPKQVTSKSATSDDADKKKKNLQDKKGERKAAKTLSAILLAFIITWTPYNILVLIKSITACSWYIPQQLWDFFYYLCYINSTVNPMCYALCNAAFRRTYVRILKCKWHNRNRSAVFSQHNLKNNSI
ncbi:Muscarinic acetylcholine receptor DM1 [Dufourea novaeangliae]|uniref:Muscarinic acetylcholine receptor DM1 n=1 Tax=Dufourea novaeangliae TaxID=178035 RepID=A0A154PMV3_DUFNO|nr:Muscarinic acetylcholine receptor DM1 [Dufourea novaeangliae]